MKKIVHSRKDEICKELFEQQSFHFCWRPTQQYKYTSNPRTGCVELVTVHSMTPAGTLGWSETDPAARQLVNHFANIDGLTTKTGLLRSLKEYYAKHAMECFDATPTTFICTSDTSEREWLEFCESFKDISKKKYKRAAMPWKHCKENMWIIKPANANQGKGIEVFKELSRIKGFMRGKPKGEEWIFQKYLERPLLLWGRKFDFRIWVLVTENFEIYIYREGYIRTSSEAYTTDLRAGKTQSMVHLTNFCMQKLGVNVGKYEDGNTLSFDDFQCYLNKYHEIDQVNFRKDIFPRIQQLVVDSILSSKAGMNDGNIGRHSFELFGFDFMIDEEYRAWLIEVNTNPFLGVQNEWHGQLVAKMIEDMIVLVIDPLYPPPKSPEANRNQTTNDWVLLCKDDPSTGEPILSTNLLSYAQRKQMGISSYYYPRVPPEAVVRQARGEKYSAGHEGTDRIRKYLNSRDRASQEARARVIKKRRAQCVRDKTESLIREAVKDNRIKRAKARIIEREDRRALFRTKSIDATGANAKDKNPMEGREGEEEHHDIKRRCTINPATKCSHIDERNTMHPHTEPASANNNMIEQATNQKERKLTKCPQPPQKGNGKNRPNFIMVSEKKKRFISLPPHTPVRKVVVEPLPRAGLENPRALVKHCLDSLNKIFTKLESSTDDRNRTDNVLMRLSRTGLDGTGYKVLQLLASLENGPFSNSVLLYFAQSDGIALLWHLCGMVVEPSLSSEGSNPIIPTIMKKAGLLMEKVANMYRVQTFTRKQILLPPISMLAHRVAVSACVEDGKKDELQLFALRGLVHLVQNFPSCLTTTQNKFCVVYVAFYAHMKAVHASAAHLSKDLINLIGDDDIEEACFGRSIQVDDVEQKTETKNDRSISTQSEDGVSGANSKLSVLYAMEGVRNFFRSGSREKIAVDNMARKELCKRADDRQKRLLERERTENEKIAEQQKIADEKKRYKEWVESRLQASMEKRQRLLLMEREKQRRMAEEERIKESEKARVTEERRMRAEQLKMEWERRQRVRRLQKEMMEQENSRAHDRFTELSLQRKEANEQQMDKWLGIKREQQARERQKRLEDYKRTSQARQLWVEQRRDRLETLMLNKLSKNKGKDGTTNREKVKDRRQKRRNRERTRNTESLPPLSQMMNMPKLSQSTKTKQALLMAVPSLAV